MRAVVPVGPCAGAGVGASGAGALAAFALSSMFARGEVHRLRKQDGLPGHPDIHATPQVFTNTGSLGMGVSKAKGFARAARLDERRRRVFVITGDGELQEGEFWESLGQAANEDFGEITVIVDHNKMQKYTRR